MFARGSAASRKLDQPSIPAAAAAGVAAGIALHGAAGPRRGNPECCEHHRIVPQPDELLADAKAAEDVT
jgi:hypothetical protein